MGLHATSRFDDGVATITLVGELDQESVDWLDSLVDAAEADGVRQLVLDAGRLTRLSSAAVRYLAHLQQKLGRGVRLVVNRPCREVAEAIRLGGLHRSVTLRQR